MSRLWWSLPGPAAFLERIGHDLQDGKSVIIRVPAHGAEGCGEVLRRKLERDWRTIEPTELSATEQLLRQFAPDHSPKAPRDVRAVVATERLHGISIQIEMEAASAAWAKWRDFLVEFAEAARSLDPFERTTFCVIVRGPPDAPLPASGVCLASHVWRGTTSALDMDLYVSHLMQSRPTRMGVEWRTAATVLSRVAAWDPEVAERLADESIERILDPAPVLAEIAGERGWIDGCRTWEDGAVNDVDGRELIHSAALGPKGDDDLLARIWAGQVAVLFPFLEEQRRALIRVHTHRLRVPFDTPDGQRVNDRRDLELGHILWQMGRDGTAPAKIVRGLRTLVRMRNALAHFEKVPAEVLLDPELRLLEKALTASY